MKNENKDIYATVERHVLIVDDEEDFVLNLIDILESRGYQTASAYSLSEAEERIREFDADVALLDIRLGQSNGLELISKLKKERPGIICVMMTAYAAIETTIRALHEGVYDYLHKPFDAQELLVVLNRCFEKIQLQTEKTAAEEALKENEERYRLVVENQTDMIVRFDLDGILLFASLSYCKTFGKTQEELIGKKFMPLIHEEDREKAEEAIKKVYEPPYNVSVEERAMTKDGWQWQEWINTAMLNEKNEIVSIVAVGRNITERKQADEELMKYRKHLEELVKERTVELNLAKEQAESADRLKSSFLATMSHELRTPLNSIIGFTGIMIQGLSGPLSDEQKEQLGMVKNSSQHLLSLINDVLDISKIEAGQMQIHSAPFDIRESILKVVQSVTPMAEKKGLSIVSRVEPDVGELVSDQWRIEQVIINLMSNAIKFTEKGEVRIECCINNDSVTTSVKDTGIGMKPEDIKRLFTPFKQIDSGLARKVEGTGLGLSICKKLIELMEGKISVESRYGEGSTFAFTLPYKTQEIKK